MVKLNATLKTFAELFNALGKDNIAIGGSNALLSHGLKLSRLPEDVDIVIYKPTNTQIKILEGLKVFDRNKVKNEEEPGYDEVHQIMKFRKNGFDLDLLIFIDMPKPANQLKVYLETGLWSVVGVDEICKAKAGYTDAKTKSYVRIKDVNDLQQLKNLNFNF